ncbi:MAG TPA: hypothetical protein VGU20_29415 [Stellaceae bacterium]|nr:hypothetical protein [Stellaceae bacterium]
MDATRLLRAGLIAAMMAGASLAPAAAQSRNGDTTRPPSAQPPSDLELRFKEGVQELGNGAQKIAAALEESARDFWAASKAAVEAGAQTWQARRDARQPAPTSPQR